MVLAVLGLNHKTAPVEVRECLACPEEAVKQALACGMNDHLAKPIDSEKLFLTLAKYYKK